MSVLEFISSLKWPIVVLIISLTALVQLRRSPEARSSFGAWFRGRNFRVQVAGQEFEATLADTVDNMTAAASGDVQLAAHAQSPHESGISTEGDESPGGQLSGEADLTGLRRSAVEAVMRNAAQWGFEMAQMGFRSPPDPQVRWADDGTPEIMFGTGRLKVAIDEEAWARLARQAQEFRGRGPLPSLRRHSDPR
ncbi:hypothetical protein [Streptomyces sp. NPDC005407]|uniref:hypothetical protein n=1 Tax=Streptomyces sp. NPDC005407 TaxID=3155340 RepID=UPI0033B07949